jgi:hypothetical protein
MWDENPLIRFVFISTVRTRGHIRGSILVIASTVPKNSILYGKCRVVNSMQIKVAFTFMPKTKPQQAPFLTYSMLVCLVYPFTLKMEATCYSEISVVIRRTTLRYIQDDGIHHNNCCENLQSYRGGFLFVKVSWDEIFILGSKYLRHTSSCVRTADPW